MILLPIPRLTLRLPTPYLFRVRSGNTDIGMRKYREVIIVPSVCLFIDDTESSKTTKKHKTWKTTWGLLTGI